MALSDFTKRKSEKLAEKGYRHLQDGDAAAAQKVSAELEALRFTAAFEIAALAHAQLGDLEAAQIESPSSASEPHCDSAAVFGARLRRRQNTRLQPTTAGAIKSG